MSEQRPGNSNPDIPPEMVDNEYYAMFAAEKVAPDLTALAAGRETEPDTRLARLFAPRLTKDEERQTNPVADEADQTEYYRRLVMGEVSEQEQAERREAAAKRQRGDTERFAKEPTVDMKLRAFQTLQNAKQDDPIIEAIVDKHIPPSDGLPDYSSVVDQVRTDVGLRYELGSYLLRDKLTRFKQESPHAVPYRVFVGTEKSPAHPGYLHLGKLNSQEYSAMLALSMVDGTYDDREDSDPIITYPDKPGEMLGQHRAAAKLLLGPLPNNYQG
jgi:hypothetical protein